MIEWNLICGPSNTTECAYKLELNQITDVSNQHKMRNGTNLMYNPSRGTYFATDWSSSIYEIEGRFDRKTKR